MHIVTMFFITCSYPTCMRGRVRWPYTPLHDVVRDSRWHNTHRTTFHKYYTQQSSTTETSQVQGPTIYWYHMDQTILELPWHKSLSSKILFIPKAKRSYSPTMPWRDLISSPTRLSLLLKQCSIWIGPMILGKWPQAMVQLNLHGLRGSPSLWVVVI
jgi:hypothetical protein